MIPLGTFRILCNIAIPHRNSVFPIGVTKIGGKMNFIQGTWNFMLSFRAGKWRAAPTEQSLMWACLKDKPHTINIIPHGNKVWDCLIIIWRIPKNSTIRAQISLSHLDLFQLGSELPFYLYLNKGCLSPLLLFSLVQKCFPYYIPSIANDIQSISTIYYLNIH